MARSSRIKQRAQHNHQQHQYQQYHIHATRERLSSLPSQPSESNIATVGSMSASLPITLDSGDISGALHPMANHHSFSIATNSAPSSMRRGHTGSFDNPTPVGSRRVAASVSALSVHEEVEGEFPQMFETECLEVEEADNIQKE